MAFAAELLTERSKVAGNQICHAAIKHIQTIGMFEGSHANFEKILR